MNKAIMLLVVLMMSSGASASVLHSVGIARDASGGSIRYVEHHQYLATGAHRVTYFDPTGEILVTKMLSYPGLPQHPDIVQADVQRDIETKARVEGGVVRMTQSQDGQVEAHVIKLDENVIVDAGFDRYLRESWSSFLIDEPQTYRFAIAGQNRTLKVAITKLGSSIDESSGEVVTSFVIRPTNFIVRLLLPEIRLDYDSERRLSAYAGFTNLKLPAGSSKSVVIDFEHYESADVLERPRIEWLSESLPDALSEPLAGTERQRSSKQRS